MPLPVTWPNDGSLLVAVTSNCLSSNTALTVVVAVMVPDHWSM